MATTVTNYNFHLPCLVLSLLFPSACSVYFKMLRFDPTIDKIQYQGDAAPSVGAVELTNKANYVCRAGCATYDERVPIWESGTGKLSDFTTQFSFSIDTLDHPDHGHGFTFFLAPVGFQIPPNSACGYLGLFNATTAHSSSNQIVLVEFDSRKNPEWDPPDVKDHVGININSISSAVYTRWNATFHSGDTAYARIDYKAATKNLSVSWRYRDTYKSQENTSLSYIIDLRKVLPEWVTIGFSAATGDWGERHTLESWEFRSNLDVKETNGKKEKKKKIIIAVTISLCVVIAGLVAGLVVLTRLKAQMKKAMTMKFNSTDDDDLETSVGLRRFSYRSLAFATNNFSDDRILGEGGSGAVYRGYLIDIDRVVAVKRISRGSKQGENVYTTELKTISQLRHRNLVHLIGWSHDGNEFLLVYEFMPNGSLDSHLFGKKRSPIPWAMRYKISLGLASALLYLHEEWEQCVVHRDIKSSNVMLDSNFNVKLGDFGLARLMDHELGPKTTGLAGTFGYLAPEYISTGRASKESDVYSFGVVALEIATGRKSVDPMSERPDVGLVEWVWDLYGSGNLIYGADERLNGDFGDQQVECLMIVGLWCAYPDCALRPSIRQAIQVLNFEAPLPILPKKMPIPVYRVPPTSADSSEPSISISSLGAGR